MNQYISDVSSKFDDQAPLRQSTTKPHFAKASRGTKKEPRWLFLVDMVRQF